MSWTKKNVHPGKIVSTSQEVDVMVLEVDGDKRRISLGLKQAQNNPWDSFAERHPSVRRRRRSQERDRIRSVHRPRRRCRRHGPHVGHRLGHLRRGRAGLHRKGEVVKAIVLDIDVEKERISLGMKQLEKGAPARRCGFRRWAGLNKNQTVTVTVLEVRDGGLEVQAGEDGVTGFIKRSDLGRDRDEQRPSASSPARSSMRWSSASIVRKKPNFSVKALQIAEEKQAVAQYGSSDSGASLGDILGEALKAKSIDAKKVPFFKPGKEIRDRLNAK
jgi:small subunit ribosomal protein S1